MNFGTFPSLAAIIMSVPGVLMGLTFHEFAHAWVATRLGDDTPRLMGRVSLNPLDHLDVWGTILIFLAGFGWAKPVQVNVSKLRPRVWGDIAVSLAGVAMNLLLAFVFFLLLGLSSKGLLFGYNSPQLQETLFRGYYINLVLVAFNLIPLPPLDGFHVARYLIPRGMENVTLTIYRYGPYLLMVLYFFPPIVYKVLGPVITGLGLTVQAVVLPLIRLL